MPCRSEREERNRNISQSPAPTPGKAVSCPKGCVLPPIGEGAIRPSQSTPTSIFPSTQEKCSMISSVVYGKEKRGGQRVRDQPLRRNTRGGVNPPYPAPPPVLFGHLPMQAWIRSPQAACMGRSKVSPSRLLPRTAAQKSAKVTTPRRTRHITPHRPPMWTPHPLASPKLYPPKVGKKTRPCCTIPSPQSRRLLRLHSLPLNLIAFKKKRRETVSYIPPPPIQTPFV